MDRGSDKHGPRLDDEMEQESQPIEHSAKEGHVEEHLDKEEVTGHRVKGTGSSADDYPYRDRGEEGGASHPKPKE